MSLLIKSIINEPLLGICLYKVYPEAKEHEQYGLIRFRILFNKLTGKYDLKIFPVPSDYKMMDIDSKQATVNDDWLVGEFNIITSAISCMQSIIDDIADQLKLLDDDLTEIPISVNQLNMTIKPSINSNMSHNNSMTLIASRQNVNFTRQYFMPLKNDVRRVLLDCGVVPAPDCRHKYVGIINNSFLIEFYVCHRTNTKYALKIMPFWLHKNYPVDDKMFAIALMKCTEDMVFDWDGEYMHYMLDMVLASEWAVNIINDYCNEYTLSYTNLKNERLSLNVMIDWSSPIITTKTFIESADNDNPKLLIMNNMSMYDANKYLMYNSSSPAKPNRIYDTDVLMGVGILER